MSVLALSAAFALTFMPPAHAQSAIVVGQSCDLSGDSSPRILEFVKGVDAYIASVNAGGGVNGRPIKLVRYDDAFKADKALENAKRLVEQDGVMVLFGMGSAPSTVAVLPYATEKGIPVFGSLSGAEVLHKPNPMLFHLHASFADEITRVMQHLKTAGFKTVAALASDLPIGKDGVVSLEAAAKESGLEIVKIARVTSDLKNLDESAAAIAKAQPQAVLILAPSGPGIKYTEALKKTKLTTQLVGLSVMSNSALYKALGEQVRGMIVTQVVPFPWSPRFAIVRDYQKLMDEAKLPISIDTMEGYTSARLLVEGLKAAGAKPTRESFIAGLESFKRKDVGGLAVSFSATDRVATRLVGITMIGANGKLVN